MKNRCELCENFKPNKQVIEDKRKEYIDECTSMAHSYKLECWVRTDNDDNHILWVRFFKPSSRYQSSAIAEYMVDLLVAERVISTCNKIEKDLLGRL